MSAPFPFDPFNAAQFDALMRAPGPDVVDCTGVQTGNTDIEASESGRYPFTAEQLRQAPQLRHCLWSECAGGDCAATKVGYMPS